MFLRNVQGFVRCQRGNVATVAALCALPLIAVVAGAVELQGISAAKANLQAAVDAGALAGAQRLGLVNANGTSDVQSAAVIERYPLSAGRRLFRRSRFMAMPTRRSTP